MEAEKIERINALAHKAKSVGLTEEEKKERELLRKEYIAYVRLNLRTQLDNIDIKEADGYSSKPWREIWTQKRKLGKKFLQPESSVQMPGWRK